MTVDQSSPQAQHIEMVRQMARRFCDEQVRPGARDRDRDGRFPSDLIAPLADLGFLGALIPSAYGGSDLDALSYAAMMEELGAADSSVRSLVSVSAGLVASAVTRWGTEQQREDFLPHLASGELGAFGLTEPGAGSDPSSIVTRAQRKGGGQWELNGSKLFITNGSKGSVTLTFAQAFDGAQHLGLSCFLVPQSTPGYVASPMSGKLGLRATDTAEVSLNGVIVPANGMLGPPGAGLKVALTALDTGRFSLAAASVGLAREALDVSLRYADERVQFGSAIAGRQLVQELLAMMFVDVTAARGMVSLVADLKQRAAEYSTEASAAKLFATEAAVRCADRAVQVHGGYGYFDDFPVHRLLRDARASTLYEGTSEIQKLIIGRTLTGVSAF